MKRINNYSELAQMYFPNCSSSRNAVRCLSRWIKRCTPLLTDLEAINYKPYRHRLLTPKQFDIIVSHLGDPFDD